MGKKNKDKSKRLTARNEYGMPYFPRCFDQCGGTGCKHPDCSFFYQICDKLCRLEDEEEARLREQEEKAAQSEDNGEEMASAKAEPKLTVSKLLSYYAAGSCPRVYIEDASDTGLILFTMFRGATLPPFYAEQTVRTFGIKSGELRIYIDSKEA